MTATLELAILLYGGLGGWLGIALAVYLYRIRPDPAHPATVLGVFSLGFAMLMATLLISDVVVPKTVWLVILFVTYTLMVLSEVGLFADAMYPHMSENIYRFVTNEPRFTRGGRAQLAKRDGGHPNQAPLGRYADSNERDCREK